ncbi:hypothetical protein RchiOBHm_Chr3g0493231 [Rosa chinensis]|uniref:Uncharacterized protein n=1 Tax=Rosa chinensis TaxID=74649 RepID=A0A2P6RGQ3_ROSCH|nr:hypothetical protein RchiOBHm_Chr3g0493231 [Rosa chinensis]
MNSILLSSSILPHSPFSYSFTLPTPLLLIFSSPHQDPHLLTKIHPTKISSSHQFLLLTKNHTTSPKFHLLIFSFPHYFITKPHQFHKIQRGNHSKHQRLHLYQDLDLGKSGRLSIKTCHFCSIAIVTCSCDFPLFFTLSLLN